MSTSNELRAMPDNFTPLINRSAVKRHALKVSTEKRNGKFTRVSSDFLERINLAVETKLRSLISTRPSTVSAEDGANFLTPDAKRKLVENLNAWIPAEIERQVHLTRVGKTL